MILFKRAQRFPRAQGSPRAQRSALGIVLSIELVLMALLFCAIVVPKLFGIVPDVVLSSSMQESAPVGSIAYLNTNADAADLQLGDIAAYRTADDASVLHRVHAINEDGTFTFKGDANNVADAAAPTSADIVGAYLFCIPYAGYCYVWVADHFAFAIALILAVNLSAYLAGKAPVLFRNKAFRLAHTKPVEMKG